MRSVWHVACFPHHCLCNQYLDDMQKSEIRVRCKLVVDFLGGSVINVGVIGYGYWGPNLVRNLFEVSETQVVAVSDMRQDRLEQVKNRYPSVEVTTDFRQLLSNAKIDAIAIATTSRCKLCRAANTSWSKSR
jgi:predicted homoserine dehydrogenase-like protein